MNSLSLKSEVATAKPGKHIVYHTGSLAFDRLPMPGMSGVQMADCATLGYTADAAYALWQARKVHLVQRKTGKIITQIEGGNVYEFDYIAVRR